MQGSTPVRFYFEVDQERVRMPVAPSELKITAGSNAQTVRLLGVGDVSVPDTPKLKDFEIEFLLPESDEYPFVRSMDWHRPSWYTALWDRLMREKKPVRMVITQVHFDFRVTIESYQRVHLPGDHKSIRYAMKLQEWREYGAKSVKRGGDAGEMPERGSISEELSRSVTLAEQTTYTVKKGDSLWKIAKRLLGNGRRETEIFALNRHLIRKKTLIRPGWVLKIPPR